MTHWFFDGAIQSEEFTEDGVGTDPPIAASATYGLNKNFRDQNDYDGLIDKVFYRVVLLRRVSASAAFNKSRTIKVCQSRRCLSNHLKGKMLTLTPASF